MRKLTALTVAGLSLALAGPAVAQYYGSYQNYGSGAYNQYGGSYGYSSPYGAQNQYGYPQNQYGYQQPYGSNQYNQNQYGSGNYSYNPSYGYGNTQPGAYGGYDWRDQRRAERRQDRVEMRMDIETALHQRGYDVGPVDGHIDEQSRAAIRQYQTDAGLPVDGRPSQDLLAHIETSTVRSYSGYSPRDFFNQFFNR